MPRFSEVPVFMAPRQASRRPACADRGGGLQADRMSPGRTFMEPCRRGNGRAQPGNPHGLGSRDAAGGNRGRGTRLARETGPAHREKSLGPGTEPALVKGIYRPLAAGARSCLQGASALREVDPESARQPASWHVRAHDAREGGSPVLQVCRRPPAPRNPPARPRRGPLPEAEGRAGGVPIHRTFTAFRQTLRGSLPRRPSPRKQTLGSPIPAPSGAPGSVKTRAADPARAGERSTRTVPE